MAIERAKQVWIDGPHDASKPDVTAFRGGDVEEGANNWDRNALYFQIPSGKKAVADKGLNGEPSKVITNSREYPKKMRDWISDVLARQETLHTLIKNFNILGQRFRHGKSKDHTKQLHKMAVEAVCVIIQYGYKNGHPPFDVTL